MFVPLFLANTTLDIFSKTIPIIRNNIGFWHWLIVYHAYRFVSISDRAYFLTCHSVSSLVSLTLFWSTSLLSPLSSLLPSFLFWLPLFHFGLDAFSFVHSQIEISNYVSRPFPSFSDAYCIEVDDALVSCCFVFFSSLLRKAHRWEHRNFNNRLKQTEEKEEFRQIWNVRIVTLLIALIIWLGSPVWNSPYICNKTHPTWHQLVSVKENARANVQKKKTKRKKKLKWKRFKMKMTP